MTGNLPPVGANVLDFDREHYPRFHDAPLVRKFCVPIQPDYHRRLFPEIAFASDLPLFPREAFGPIIAYGQERTPGNTIRKVYLCRAKITRLRPGDILFFYMSKDDRYALSQSITTVAKFQPRYAPRARVRALWGLSGWRGNERIADSIKKGPPGARAGGGCCSGSDRAPNFQGSAGRERNPVRGLAQLASLEASAYLFRPLLQDGR